MIPLGGQPDSWLADVASYVRNAFGNSAPFITPAEVAAVRSATSGRTSAWTETELAGTVPRALEVAGPWTATASHNAAQASRALGTTMQTGPWTSGTAQAPGMWFQVDLPAPVTLVEVQIDTTTIGGARGGAGGGGGRGRGAGPAPLPDTGFPRGYRLDVSEDGSQWATVAEGAGAALTTTAAFRPVRTRFVRILQTADTASAPNWIIQRIRLYEAP
jgi:hypothetical protein